MKRCAFDIETDKRGKALLRAGWAVADDDAAQPMLGTCSPHEVGDLIEHIAGADVLIGHNIADFDIPFLAERFDTVRRAVGGKPVIDTLYLSPVAFPRNPYHHLYKDYKPFPLAPNDPAQDALAAMTLLVEEENALNELPDQVRAILLALLERFPKTADAAHRLGVPEDAPARSILAGLFRHTDDQFPSTPDELAEGMLAVARDRLCIHAVADVARRAWADPQSALNHNSSQTATSGGDGYILLETCAAHVATTCIIWYVPHTCAVLRHMAEDLGKAPTAHIVTANASAKKAATHHAASVAAPVSPYRRKTAKPQETPLHLGRSRHDDNPPPCETEAEARGRAAREGHGSSPHPGIRLQRRPDPLTLTPQEVWTALEKK